MSFYQASVEGACFVYCNNRGYRKGGRHERKGLKQMKQVARFQNIEKPAHVALNEWLRKNPDADLIDIKVHVSKNSIITIYAIVEVSESAKEEKTV